MRVVPPFLLAAAPVGNAPLAHELHHPHTVAAARHRLLDLHVDHLARGLQLRSHIEQLA
jgi:hypothetical protein